MRINWSAGGLCTIPPFNQAIVENVELNRSAHRTQATVLLKYGTGKIFHSLKRVLSVKGCSGSNFRTIRTNDEEMLLIPRSATMPREPDKNHLPLV